MRRTIVGLTMVAVGVGFFIGTIMFYGDIPVVEVPLLGNMLIIASFILIVAGVSLSMAVLRDL